MRLLLIVFTIWISLFIICSASGSLYAQSTELRVSLNSGLYAYRGSGAEANSFINSVSYTNDPYGSRGGLSYGASFDLRQISKTGFIWGANLGYEMLRSKVNLKYNDVIGDIRSNFEGHTYLNSSMINLFPYIGGRILVAGRSFDVTGGFDVGYILSMKEKGHARSIDNAQFDIRTSVDRRTLKTDIRPRLQLATDFDRIGAFAGYAIGMRNFTENYIGGSQKTYSQIWRFGFTYRLN